MLDLGHQPVIYIYKRIYRQQVFIDYIEHIVCSVYAATVS